MTDAVQHASEEGDRKEVLVNLLRLPIEARYRCLQMKSMRRAADAIFLELRSGRGRRLKKWHRGEVWLVDLEMAPRSDLVWCLAFPAK